MLPQTIPTLDRAPIRLRPFASRDASVVVAAAADPLIPLITTVPADVEPWNAASWRAAERAGYRREGLLRSWQLVGAERRDMYLYARIR